ncbi:hypothetical protein B0X71_16980 [Planococcus lenghuensis]|uniref:Uncharacterized protein n=1 Tax=Planococcus lenghuensis TaxID=2213202 RepID=A0A1Q2L2G9_9BACL|nr:hypothetical protein B0X71_16980 [Planococcus lenghuensis]
MFACQTSSHIKNTIKKKIYIFWLNKLYASKLSFMIRKESLGMWYCLMKFNLKHSQIIKGEM